MYHLIIHPLILFRNPSSFAPMTKDQVFGAVILAASIVGIAVYAWLLYALPMITLQVTAFIVIGAVLIIVAWIGWVMATTPPPAPLEPELTPTSGSSGTKAEGAE